MQFLLLCIIEGLKITPETKHKVVEAAGQGLVGSVLSHACPEGFLLNEQLDYNPEPP